MKPTSRLASAFVREPLARTALLILLGVWVGFITRGMITVQPTGYGSNPAGNTTTCCGPGCRNRVVEVEAHYDEKYFAWQTDEGKEKAAKRNWTKHLEVRPDDVVCDLGAGGGHILATLTTASHRVAVEINPHARHFMSRTYPFIERYQFPEDVPDDSLDLVYTTSAIEHFECPLTELRAIVSKLRPGGRLIVGVKNEGLAHAGGASTRDIHKHLWTWNRQLLFNLLYAAGVRDVHVTPTSEELLSNANRFFEGSATRQPFVYHWARGVKE